MLFGAPGKRRSRLGSHTTLTDYVDPHVIPIFFTQRLSPISNSIKREKLGTPVPRGCGCSRSLRLLPLASAMLQPRRRDRTLHRTTPVFTNDGEEISSGSGARVACFSTRSIDLQQAYIYVQLASAKLATYGCLCFVARKSIQLLRHSVCLCKGGGETARVRAYRLFVSRLKANGYS